MAREMSPAVSRCLIQREPALVDRWLRTLPGSLEEDRLVSRAEPRFPACFGQVFGFNGTVWMAKYDKPGMRAALVRALLQARRGDLPRDPPPGADAPYYSGAAGAGEVGENAAAIVAADMASCLARKHWRNVVAIIDAVDPRAETFWSESRKARLARKREAAAVDSELRKILPSIAGCVPAGTKLRMDRPRLRSLLEEAAWHLVNGDRPVSAGSDAHTAQ